MADENKEVDWLTKAFFEGIKNYYENTVEITKTVRVPKGKYCDNCPFVKTDYYALLSDDCCNCTIVSCSLYGDRLKLYDSSLYALLPYTKPIYYKCEKCKKDTENP